MVYYLDLSPLGRNSNSQRNTAMPWLHALCAPNLLNFIGSMAVTKSNHDVITKKINFLSRLVTAPSVLSELRE